MKLLDVSVFLFFLLFLLIPLREIPEINPLFTEKCPYNITNWYGFISVVSILIFYCCLHKNWIGSITREKCGIINRILVATLFGILLGVFTIYTLGPDNSLNEIEEIINSIFLAPPFEEIIYRGCLISIFLMFFEEHDNFKKHYPTAIFIALIVSSFIFGWIHSTSEIPEIYATIGGVIFGIVYLFDLKNLVRWQFKIDRNIWAAIGCHIAANIIGSIPP